MDGLSGEEALVLLKAEASLNERTAESVKKYLAMRTPSLVETNSSKGFVTLKDLFLLTLDL
jgi:hypothetical protein